MPFPRVGGTAVMLPNGHIVLLNGAAQGVGNQFQSRPVLTALLYNPYAPQGKRYTKLAASDIARTYHSNALLLPDGNILVGGGDQGEAYSDLNGGPLCGSSYNYELRTERFMPPYAFVQDRVENLTISSSSNQIKFGQTLQLSFQPNAILNVTGASLVTPSAVTHSTDMSGRVVILSSDMIQVDAAKGVAHVTIPQESTKSVLEGWHMIFLLTGDPNFSLHSATSAWVQFV
jgi:hypothetical protein